MTTKALIRDDTFIEAKAFHIKIKKLKQYVKMVRCKAIPAQPSFPITEKILKETQAQATQFYTQFK